MRTATVPDQILENALLFGRALRLAGLPVSPVQSQNFVAGLTHIDVGDREQFYHTARSFLVTRQEHLALFTIIFNQFWHKQLGLFAGKGQPMPVAPRHRRPKEKRYDIVGLMAQRAQPTDRELDLPERAATYSDLELMRRKSFAMMTPEELENIKRLIQEMRWQVSLRRSRRWVPDRKGTQLHLRRMLRGVGQFGQVPPYFHWQSRKIKQRPVVLLADISGSMEKYARLLLQFFYSIEQSLDQVEAFLFGTRLTRVTPHLKYKNIDRAVHEAARSVYDWSGGTRIGASLRQFNRAWSRRVLRRGALVIIVSDGWERGDVAGLRQEMRYLQHRCHRLIWLNPLLGAPGYQPLVEGMAAALPYIDDFLPCHNLQSLTELANHIGRLSSGRSTSRILPARNEQIPNITG